jgi:hypothetical protein
MSADEMTIHEMIVAEVFEDEMTAYKMTIEK